MQLLEKALLIGFLALAIGAIFPASTKMIGNVFGHVTSTLAKTEICKPVEHAPGFCDVRNR